MFRRFMAADLVLLVPLSGLAASLLTAGVFLVAVKRRQALSALTSTLLLLVYFTNHIHLVTAGMFYRSTKPLLAPTLIATGFYVLALLDAKRGTEGWLSRQRAPAVVFGLCCVRSLLDRQGFFYALIGFAVLLTHAIMARRRWDVVAAAGTALGCMMLYNLAVAPWIVQRISGYSPNVDYQKLPIVTC